MCWSHHVVTNLLSVDGRDVLFILTKGLDAQLWENLMQFLNVSHQHQHYGLVNKSKTHAFIIHFYCERSIFSLFWCLVLVMGQKVVAERFSSYLWLMEFNTESDLSCIIEASTFYNDLQLGNSPVHTAHNHPYLLELLQHCASLQVCAPKLRCLRLILGLCLCGVLRPPRQCLSSASYPWAWEGPSAVSQGEEEVDQTFTASPGTLIIQVSDVCVVVEIKQQPCVLRAQTLQL